MQETKEDQLWNFRENTAKKSTPQLVIGQTTQASSYSSLGHKMWTRIQNSLAAELDFQRHAGTI